mgnify:CR=1 FL=1
MTSTENPFGTRITTEDIIDTLAFFDDWEHRYKYIIDLGKELPPLPESLQTEDRKIRGCQSQVWIDTHLEGEHLRIDADSDAFIVKGLLAIVLAAYNNQSPEDIVAFDIDSYFEALDLLGHLSPSRGNGLRAMVARIKDIAAAANP